MTYEAFARKYRPKDFKSVVGQEHVVNTLKNAIRLNKVSHGYIFAGPRGVGKTTIARILTKSLNCQKGITDEPCGVCENCIEIDKGSFPDMYEIDAASNRGIDDIRALKENINYAPIKGRYKVYIIDEAHMLTKEAFNALLKTLEEPPPNNIFILATTELHKIPDTIKSRTQVFLFKPIKENQIKQYLIKILENENIPYEEEAVELIAKFSEGGVRDSASLLDQATTYAGEKLTLEKTQQLLGVISSNVINQFLKYLKEKDIKQMIIQIENLYKEGQDLTVFWKQILNEIHNELINIAIEEKGKIFEKEDLKYLIYVQSVFNKAFIEAKSSGNEKNIYELAILKIKYIKELTNIDDILKDNVKITSSIKQEVKEEKKEEAKEEKKDNLEYILAKISKEAGAIVASAIKKSKIEDKGNILEIKAPEILYDNLVAKKDIIEKYFNKEVSIIKTQPENKKKKSKKRDEAVDKVLNLFEGKIINYKEE
ncbi:DNA polymerase III subunit gamma/tau [Hydrogenothermus marinus]|uniref:DNA polymerase III subunit gamma/tau n=1 Tax=Hydrogenothermus marinus TaxID=133270 RepID=A0A3M0BMJ2_9AQUI|nr:DNA polymerase III subunit gamma/tau [Hydrogenothermus marinus]RMA97694.1 DNA polymerase-3 subunit gamma/tau [Hydrogenothermus marinus]